ncbi:myosin heavy chain [Nosema bombycis CQ1]|uniref:Myosin heavy chain n=1 Tax=Nosema bombycis (strain CQ1 / CVCC 102059) TaxID=578461 RepID=R0KNA2_NOSB1|nr:myosin heavy chain [Nosema bombycis CQ1]|eukprot:EOB12146.1 myosin heavy chain [Nosema bombycis CQ1]
MLREIYEQKTQSESSDDSNSGTEKFINLLEQEKKLRREIEQKIIEKENEILILRNENIREAEDKGELLRELDILKVNLKKFKNNDKEKEMLSKEMDLILKDLNNLILGINTKYFKILEENRENIKNLKEKLILKEEKIKNMEVEISEISKDLEEAKDKINNLNHLKVLNSTKINNLLNEFDSLKITNLSLETELEEKISANKFYKRRK